MRQHLRTKQAELSITDNRHLCVFRVWDSLEDAARGCERFSKDCLLVRNLVGHRQQIYCRQFQKLGVSAITAHDPEHGAMGAMSRITSTANIAAATARVNLADDTLARLRRVSWRRRYSVHALYNA